MKKPSRKKPSRTHAGRGEKKKKPSYAEHREAFMARKARSASLRIDSWMHIRKRAVYAARDQSRKYTHDDLTLISVSPQYDIALVCGALLKGRFCRFQIDGIFRDLFRNGDYLEFRDGDFDWGVSPHEYPIHIFIEFLAESLLDVRKRNPSWGFMMRLRDQAAFQTILEESFSLGLRVKKLLRMLKNMNLCPEDWQLAMVQELVDSEDAFKVNENTDNDIVPLFDLQRGWTALLSFDEANSLFIPPEPRFRLPIDPEFEWPIGVPLKMK